jgi:hypothetical protein
MALIAVQESLNGSLVMWKKGVNDEQHRAASGSKERDLAPPYELSSIS